MSADAVEQADAQAEQAGKESPPFSFTARMKPKRLTGEGKNDGESEKSDRKGVKCLFILPLPGAQKLTFTTFSPRFFFFCVYSGSFG